MKEKNKSILKKIGLGAMACLGLFTFVGCSSVEISKDQLDTIMETVEQSNKYMQDQIDLLKKQNEQLQNQNNILTEQNNKLEDNNLTLEEQNQILENANNKLTKQDAADIIKYAITKISLNIDGVLDNCNIRCDEIGINVIYYKTEDNVRMIYDNIDNSLIYDTGSECMVCELSEDNQIITKTKDNTEQAFEEYLIGEDSLFGDILNLSVVLESENIISYRLIDDGNYEIKTYIYKDSRIHYANFVIDKEYRIINIEQGVATLNDIHIEYLLSVNLEYGVITYADIAEVFENAQAADPQS